MIEMKDTSLVVALRTHVWNEEVAVLARRLAYFSQGVEFVILADETNGVLETGGFKKIAHNNDFSQFGVANYPARLVLWYNGDYPLYVLRREFPQATHLAMVEYDVAVNTDVAAIMRDAQARKIDLIADRLGPASPDWHWWPSLAPHFAQPMIAFIQFVVVSARAVDALLRSRQALMVAKVPDCDADWPFCEGFIPSVIAGLENAQMVKLDHYARLPHFDVSGHRHLHDPEVNQLGTLSHPVVGETMLLNRLLEAKAGGIEALFDPKSKLRQQLYFCEPATFSERLFAEVQRLRSSEALAAYLELTRQLGWPMPEGDGNVARFKPTSMSSISQWSRVQDPEVESRGGNDGIIKGGCGFHTDLERDPWWQVDLEDFYAVARVVVFNRLDLPERCTRMSVSGSEDGRSWVLWAVKLDDVVFGGADGNPYVFAFAPPFRARFVRITLIGEGFLHLDEIEVYGKRVAAA
jgi:hypothetical protein